MNSLFSQIDCFLNLKPVSLPNNLYPYRSYIETLLNYGHAAKNSHLMSVLWYKDTASKMDNTEEENEGLVARQSVMKENTVNPVGFLHCVIFNTNELMPNGVEFRVRIMGSKDLFDGS